MSAGCQAADVATTLFGVHQRGLKEANPIMPNPKTQPELFVGVKLSLAWLLDRGAKRGYQRDVRTAAKATCGIALWNLVQAIK